MKKTIKYLQNGEYHYATVKDVGDIDLLKTSNKDDLVSAINEIIVNGVSGGDGISQDQLDKINTDILGVSADIAAKYSELQDKISDGDAMQASLRAQAIKDINGAIAAANAAIEEYKKANEEAVKATQADINAQNDRIDRINEQADALRTDLATAQTDLTKTKTDLSNAKLDFGKVRKSVVDLENEVSTKLSNTDLDPLNQKIQSVESNVKQTKDELSQYVKHDEYDLTTGEVNKIKSNVKQLADRVETKVSRDTLNDDINEFVVKKANLLVQTRDWSIIDDVGWTFSDDGLIAIQAELYDHAHVLELHQTGVYAEQTVKGLHGGQSYTVSVSAKINDAASGVNITLVGNNKTLGIMRRVKTHDTDISTEYERYEYTLVAPSDTLVLRFIATGMASSNVLYLYKAKLEEGTKSYEWEMNVNDLYAKVEKNSAKFTTYDDRITGVVKKQRDFGTWKEQAQSTITQTADGLKINNQKLKNVNGDVVDVIQSKINASAEKLTSNYEKFTNQQVGMIVDEGTNQILNSAFTYYDLDSKDVKKRKYTFDSWQNISAKATIKSIGKANWVHMAQSGLSSDNPISITSNAFAVKQGKVIVGVDVLTPNVRAIDNQKVLVLQFYDDDGTRVDYREVSLHDLGLDTIQSNVSKRGKYRVGIDRKDVTKMTVLARLPRNGEINFTNFFAKVSSLDNGDYQPNPADLQQQTIKQQTAIEQTADTIRLKADQTTVDTLNGTVQRQGTLIEQNAQHIQLKADGTTVTALSNKTDELSKLVSKHSASLEVTDKAITQQASEISSVTTIANGANSKIDNLSFGGRNLLDRSDGQFVMGYGITNTTWENGKAVLRYNSADVSRNSEILPQNAAFSLQFPVARGEQLTQSIYLDTDANINFNKNFEFSWFDLKDGHKFVRANIDKIGQNTYRLWGSYIWDRNDSNLRIMDIANLYKVVDFRNSGTYLAFYHPQIEKGSRPSDYSLSQNDLQRLASEDTASQISQYNTGTVQPIKGIANDALDKANNANDKIDGLRIGGRNYLRESWVTNRNAQSATYDSNTKTWTVELTAGGGDGFGQGLQFISTADRNLVIPYGQTAIVSMEIKPEYNCSFVFDINNHPMSGSAWASNDNDNRGESNISPNNNNLIGGQWNKVFYTVANTSPKNTNKVDIYDSQSNFGIMMKNQSKAQTVYIRYIMWELGTVAGNYYPSDLDLPATIVTTVTEVSNAQQIINSSGIHTDINKVRTETTGKIDTVNSRVSDVSGRVDNVNNKINNLSFGGTNLINNSGNPKTTDGWAVWGANPNHRFIVNRHNFWKNAQETLFTLFNSNSSEVTMCSNRVKVERNTEYTLSYWAFEDSNVVSSDTFFMGRKNGETSDFTKIIGLVRGRVYSGSHAEYVTITFNTGDCDEGYIRFDNNGSRNVGHEGGLYLANIQLEKGNKASDWSMSQNDAQKVAHDDAASQINTFDTKNITPIKQTVTQYTNKTDELAGSVTHFMGAIGYDGTTFTDKFKKVVETAGGTKETYRALEGKIDGIVVGGKNLLDNSDGQLVMGYGIDNTTWTNGKATLTYNHDYSKTNKKSEILPQTGSINQWYRVNKDEELTQSIIVETDATYNPNGVYQFTWLTYEFGHRYITANIDVLGTNKYRLWCSFKWDKDQSCNVRIMDIQNLINVLQINTSGTYISFYHPQIERGNKPSDWGMSDNDINQKVDAAKSNLTQYVSQQITDAKQKMTEYTNDKTKDISTIKQTADKVSISVGKMFGKADASSLDVDANGIKLRSDLIQLGTSDSYQNMVTVDPYDDKTTIPSSFYGGTAIDYRQADGETRGIKKANVNNDYLPLSTHQPLAGVHPQDKIYFKMKFGNYNNSNCGYSLELWVYDGATYRGKHVLASTSASSAGAIPARNWERIEGWWVAPSNLFYGAGNPRYVLAISGTKGFDVEVLRPRVSRSQMTDIRLDGDVTIAPGFQLKADYIKSGTLNTDNLIMRHPQGSTVTFTQDGFDVQKSDNREAFYTIGGDGMDFWRMTENEAMNDYPNHAKPGYAHLGSLVALDNGYTKSVRRVDKQQQGIQYNHVTNDNGIGVILDVTGGSDSFAILQKGAAYRHNENGKLNYNDTVNNSHFPLWEVNATGYGSITYPQSNYMQGRGIINYTNTYYYTDMIKGSEYIGSSGVNYQPTKRLGFIGDNGWGDFAITADNNNTMAVGAGSHNQNVWVNGFIFGSQNGADRIFGYDGNQWVDFVNKRTTRDNNDLTNHFASLHLWELQYSVLTHTSQLSKKTDIEPLDTKDFASKILSIDLYKYRYKTQDKNEKDNYGAIIDDVNEVKQYNLPQEFITTRDKGINDSHLITGLIATVQEQAKQIEQLSFRILELERGASING